MENYLMSPITVPLEQLYPDPNNPRLALGDEAPGYEDAEALFDEDLSKRIFEELGAPAYGIDDLVKAISGQGWLPIDAVIVWKHPGVKGKYVVVEGNRRRISLDRIHREELPKAQRKLERMRGKGATFSKHQFEEQERLVRMLEKIVQDTGELMVLPIDAATAEELDRKLPRVLAVRHIQGAKEWGNFAEDLWLLARYNQLFEDKHGDKRLFWDNEVVERVAEEASLGTTKTKRQVKAASWFSHFQANWEDELPAGEQFEKSDYYLFELLSSKPWVRQRLHIGEDEISIPQEAEEILFKWVFKLPRPGTGDENPNVFYRHENIRLWDEIRRYDEKHGTGFASRFDVTIPDDVPTMHEVEAEYLSHKARRKPHAVLDDLLRRLSDLTAETLATEGAILRAQLEQLRDQSEKFLKMIEAAEES